MKRRTTILSVLVLVVVLAVSAVFQVSQAVNQEKTGKGFLRYDLSIIFGTPTFLSIDDSGAPELIKMVTQPEILDCNLTIDDTVYYYPDDYAITVIQISELNPITGEGLIRAEATMTFNVLGNATLSFAGVSRIAGWQSLPNGVIISPENAKAEGQFELTGTKRLSDVEGFGIGNTNFIPSDYVNLYVRQMGYIKGWN